MTAAFVTLATNDAYSVGALVLAQSLKATQSTVKRCVLVTDEVTAGMVRRLTGVYDEVISVQQLDSGDAHRLALLKRPELGVTFTKLHLWKLTQYAKVVFLDADVLVLQNIDDLVDKPELSAAPDVGWPDCFNSGVFVAQPSMQTFEALEAKATSAHHGSFDGGDQGILNDFFPNWNRISFLYNVTPSAFYSYAPAFKRFNKEIKALHFIGARKPWHSRQGNSEASQDMLNKWWAIHDAHYGAEPTPGLYATYNAASAASSAASSSASSSSGSFQKAGGERPDRQQHLKNFMTYRVTWQEDEDIVVTKESESAPIDPALDQRGSILEQMKKNNIDIAMLKLDPKKNGKAIDDLEERNSILADSLSKLK